MPKGLIFVYPTFSIKKILPSFEFLAEAGLAHWCVSAAIQAICVQSSYNMGYVGVKTAYDIAIAKKKVPVKVDTGFLIVTKDNIDSTAAKNVLY